MLPSKIELWGDSTARGVIYDERRGRYAISKERGSDAVARELGITVENHAKMGATSDDGLVMFESATETPGALCAFMFGGNDCDLDWAHVAQHENEPVKAKVPLNRFVENLRRLVARAKALKMRPVLITPPPLHAKRYFAWVTKALDSAAVERALGDVEAIYRWQERYSKAVEQIARELSCPLFDARGAILSHQRDYAGMICVDGIHPSDEGHKAIARAAIDAVAALLAREKEPAIVSVI